jgi:hypothetical protein
MCKRKKNFAARTQRRLICRWTCNWRETYACSVYKIDEWKQFPRNRTRVARQFNLKAMFREESEYTHPIYTQISTKSDWNVICMASGDQVDKNNKRINSYFVTCFFSSRSDRCSHTLIHLVDISTVVSIIRKFSIGPTHMSDWLVLLREIISCREDAQRGSSIWLWA